MKILTIAVLLLMSTVACGAESPELTDDPKLSPQQLLDQGVKDLRAGRVDEALKKLDQVVVLDPASEPFLWQRGIAQYLTGKYVEGRKQFELHRTVNPNDVENATWHFLCVAASEGPEAARKALLPAPNDRRIPQREIYELYRGTGTEREVEAAVAKTPADSLQRRDARFYADLYLGLLAHAEGNAEQAKKFLTAAAKTEDQNVMADVGRICHQILIKKSE